MSRRGGGDLIEEYVPLFLLLPPPPHTCKKTHRPTNIRFLFFIWATHTHTHTHARERVHKLLIYLTVFFFPPLLSSLSLSPTNKKHSPHFSTSKLGSSTSKRPKEGACGTAFATTYHPCNRVASRFFLSQAKSKVLQQQACVRTAAAAAAAALCPATVLSHRRDGVLLLLLFNAAVSRRRSVLSPPPIHHHLRLPSPGSVSRSQGRR